MRFRVSGSLMMRDMTYTANCVYVRMDPVIAGDGVILNLAIVQRNIVPVCAKLFLETNEPSPFLDHLPTAW